MKMSLPLILSGTVIPGDKLGRTIGFPTANLDVKVDPQTLEAGVYLGMCKVNGHDYHCLPYFGPRLVLGEMTNSFEVYIYDFDKEIYGQQVEVTLQTYLRPPLKFENFEQLKTQLETDKQHGLKLMNDIAGYSS